MKSFCLKPHEVTGLLDGTVSMIVRPVEPPPGRALIQNAAGDWRGCDREGIDPNSPTFHCPFGAAGDRLWGRETWRISVFGGSSDYVAVKYRDGTVSGPIEGVQKSLVRKDGGVVWAWRPSIHMPRWACRLVIETESVRAGLVNEIMEAEVMFTGTGLAHWAGDDSKCWPRTAGFAQRWNKHYGSRHPWDTAFAWFARVKRVEVKA